MGAFLFFFLFLFFFYFCFSSLIFSPFAFAFYFCFCFCFYFHSQSAIRDSPEPTENSQRGREMRKCINRAYCATHTHNISSLVRLPSRHTGDSSVAPSQPVSLTAPLIQCLRELSVCASERASECVCLCVCLCVREL